MQTKYIILRILLSAISILGILIINFILLNFFNTTPIDSVLNTLQNRNLGSSAHQLLMNNANSDLISSLQKHFSLDAPPIQRFFTMLKNYISFNFGNSFFIPQKVSTIIFEKMMVSFPILLISTILTYIIALLLGFYKALHNGGKFDKLSSLILIILYGIPVIVMANILLLVFKYPFIVLPVIINIFSGLLFVTFLSKTLFLNEMQKTYYNFARLRGINKKNQLKFYLLKPILIILLADLPSIFIMIFFGSSIFMEIIFNIDGFGLLSFNSFINKDYPIVLAIIYLMSISGIILRLFNDILMSFLDPRIKFKVSE